MAKYSKYFKSVLHFLRKEGAAHWSLAISTMALVIVTGLLVYVTYELHRAEIARGNEERTRRTIELLGRLDDVNVRAPDARPCMEYLTLAFDHHRLNAQDIYDALVEFKSLPKIDDPTGLECFSNLDMPGSTGAEQREMREAKYLQDQIFDFLNELELAVVWAEQNPNGAFDLPLLQKELTIDPVSCRFLAMLKTVDAAKPSSGFEASWPALYKDGKDWGCPKP